MKLVFLYLSLMASVTKATPLDTNLYNHVLDDENLSGPCRGSAPSDKVESRAKAGVSQLECETECTGDDDCVAYTYSAESEGGYCIIYGPGQSGSCADYPDAHIRPHCGECSVEGKLDIGTCGTCKIPDGQDVYADGKSYADNEGFCSLQKGKWTEGKWTEGTWNEPTNGWIGESTLTTHVNYVTAVAGYDCYDKDQSDHLAKCFGTITGSTETCEERFLQEIEGKDQTELTENDCTSGGSGCTYTPAPEPPVSILFVHSPISTTPGWKKHNIPYGDALNEAVPIKLGACRSEGTNIAPPTQKDCLNTSCQASNGEFVGTQEGCKQACLDDPSGTCVGYSHADNAWCVLHGPHAHIHSVHTNRVNGEFREDTWNVRDRPTKFCMENIPDNPPGCNNGNTAKPNHKYMCQMLRTDHTRWEAFGPFDNSPREVSIIIMTEYAGNSAGLDSDNLRKRIADLAFWKEEETELTLKEDADGVELHFVLRNIDKSFAEPMMRLMRGQFDNADVNGLMKDVIPRSATITDYEILVAVSNDNDKDNGKDNDKGNGNVKDNIKDNDKDKDNDNGNNLNSTGTISSSLIGAIIMLANTLFVI